MKIEVEVCNICKSIQRATSEYTIKQGRRTATVALCAEHAEPIERVMPRPRKATARRGSTAHKVTTLEEIEAQKAERAVQSPPQG